MLPLEDLKAKAKAATPGPWRAGGTGAVICDTELDSVHFPVIADLHHNDRDHVEQNQAYIAAASPDVVLKLIERIEMLEARKCSHGDYRMYGTTDCDNALKCDGRTELYIIGEGHCIQCRHAREALTACEG